MDFANPDNSAQFQDRLAETIAWCALQDWTVNPAQGLRSSQLCPPAITDHIRAIFDLRLPREEEVKRLAIDDAETKRQWQQNVEQLAVKRATLLLAQNLPAHHLRYPLAGGRLLIYNPDESTSDGAANLATQGFINDDNEPAWDTWIAYVGDSVNGTRHYHPFDSYLLSWVPDPLIEVVQHGMDCNSDNCHHWVNDLDSVFIRQLRQTGLIR